MSRIDTVRQFNRFYTRRIGALQAHYLGSPFPLPQARVLYELGQRGECTASALGADLDLDLGYLSRLLQGLKRLKLIEGERAQHDARHVRLTLTPKGRRAFAVLDEASRRAAGDMLAPLPAPQREEFVKALHKAHTILDGAKGEITLRSHGRGDMGWVVERHAVLYGEQDGWGAAFEALVAGIVKDFLENLDTARERCWIAERDGERVGCVFVVNDKGVARLRLLLVEPSARGSGLGRRLVEECIRFSRKTGYRKLVLWTHAHLLAARAIYAASGFRKLKKTEVHDTFGPRAVSEFWELDLRPAQRGT